MPFNDHFWKQVSKKAAEKKLNKDKPKKPVLSLEKLYSIVQENNYALFAQDITPDSQSPSSPSSNATPIGVVSKEFLNKVKKGVKLQSSSINAGYGEESFDLLTAIVREKCKISAAYTKLMVTVLTNAIENSNYEHGVDLLKYVWDKYISGQSLINALRPGKYNVLNEVTSQIPSNLQSTDLEDFLKIIYLDTTKFAATNVGIGEFFYSIFSQAVVGADDNAKDVTKSGDLKVGDVDIEVKGGDARYDGSDFIFDSAKTITNLLPQFKVKQSLNIQKERFKKDLLKILQSLASVNFQTKKQLTDFVNYTNAKLGEKSFSHGDTSSKFITLVKDINNFIELSEKNGKEPTLASKCTSDYKLPVGTRVKTSLFEVIKKTLDVSNNPEKLEKIPKGTNPLNTLDSAFDIIRNSEMVISTQDLLTIVCSTNNYSPEVLNKLGYDIKADLGSILGNDPQHILSLSSSFWRKMIGAMHVVSYMYFRRAKKEDQLLLVGKNKGNVLLIPVPLNLEAGMSLTNTPNVQVELNLDNPDTGKMVRSRSVQVFLYD
jgi:hypothetical protein